MNMNTVIQLPFKEYAQTWADLIHTFYQEGRSDETLFQDLGLDQEGEVQFSLELATVLALIAVMSFRSKPKLCYDEKLTQKLKDRIVYSTYKLVLPDADEESLKSCQGYFTARLGIFTQICKNIYSTNPKKRQPDLVGFARYLVAQVSPRQEETHAVALERVGILLSSASDAFILLLENSAQDAISLTGKPTFVVKKEKDKKKK